jgi:predicted DNA-binding transcriptional regulator AlpA
MPLREARSRHRKFPAGKRESPAAAPPPTPASPGPGLRAQHFMRTGQTRRGGPRLPPPALALDLPTGPAPAMNRPRPELGHLLQAPISLATLPREDIPVLLGDLETLRARLWDRLLDLQPLPAPPDAGQDHLLSPQEAAALIGVSRRWLYRHHSKLPFTRRLSRRTLRFSTLELTRWLAQQQHGRRGARFSNLER